MVNQFADIAPVVGQRYRLRPEDLLSGAIETTIINVSMEGLEVIRPVLHFDRLDKPLVLNPETANDLASVTRSAIPEEWIGHRVKLASIERDGDLQLTILGPDANAPEPVQLTRRSAEARRQRTRALLLALVVLSIFVAVFWLENSPLVEELLQIIFGSE